MPDDEEKTEKKRGFVVIDRRGSDDTTTSDAQEQPGEPAQRAAAERSSEAASPAEPGAQRGEAERSSEGVEPRPAIEGELPKIDFSTFALSLATSVMYHMGLIEDPETKERSKPNLPLARQAIDTLELLREKTKGNLSAEEERLLESLLYDLRMRFVSLRK